MKIRKRIALVAALAVCRIAVMACGPYERGYLAGQYNLFHLDIPEAVQSETHQKNIADWIKQTSVNIPAKDVEEVVYRWDIARVQQLRGSTPPVKGNKFAEWLVTHHDTDAINCLVLAKRSANVRRKQFTKWYYQSEKASEYQELDAIQREAEAYKGSRLADRYAFQAMRALFGKLDYKGCVEYWNRHRNKFTPGTAVYSMAEDYAIGCTQHISGEKKSYAEAFKALPEIDWPLREIKDRIYRLESESSNFRNNTDESRENLAAYRALYDKIRPILADCKGPNRAKWYYTGAFITAKLGDMPEALNLVGKAQATAADPATRDDVRVLALYIRAKEQKEYDGAFERYLAGELTWLDEKIRQELTPELRQLISRYGMYNHLCGFSQYYWNDAMRKILIGEVAPLCFRSGETVRGLQYLNYADNCIFNIVGRFSWAEYDEDYNEHWHEESLREFRYAPWPVGSSTGIDEHSYDYANDYFLCLDSIGVNNIVALTDRIKHPESALDRLLNSGSYTDAQFLDDIIGTQFLAEMDYENAVKYLSRVSPEFNRSRQIYRYTNRNPFDNGKEQGYDPLYKLNFARKMAALGQKTEAASDPDDKAELMLEYNRAIIMSTRRCWPLTSYYEGLFYNFPYYGKRLLSAYYRMYRCTKEDDNKAFAMFTDPERAARAYCRYGLFRTAEKKYPASSVIREYKTKCDNLYDYRIYARRNPREETWYSPIRSKWDYGYNYGFYDGR